MKKIVYILLVVSTSLFSQYQKKIDSLNTIISNTNLTETKLEAYKEILYFESSFNLDNLLINIEKIKDLHENESCDACLGVALYWEGLYYYLKGDPKKGIPFFESSKKAASEAGDNYISNRCLTLLSAIFFGLNDYTKAEEYASMLIKNGEAQDEITDAYIDGYFMKGLINDDQSYYSLAISNYNKADSLNTAKNGGNFYSYQGKLYNNLSIVFIQIKDFEKAASYLKKTELNYKKNSNKESLYSVKQNFGYLEVERGNFKKAIEILTETKKFYSQLEMKHREGESNHLLGRAYYGLKKYNTAIQYLDMSVEGFINAGDSLNAGLSHTYIGDSYLELNDFQNSKINYEKALAIFNTKNAHRNQINTLKSFSGLMEKTKNYKEAIRLNKQFDSINSLFQKKQNEREVFELDTKYQTEKKEQEIVLLTAQNKLAEEQKANQRNIFVAAIAIVTLAGLFFFFQYRNRQKTNKKLREIDAAKSTFFTNISHEFRTPLTLIKGPIEDQLENNSLPRDQYRNLKVAHKNTERLENLVGQLLSLSKLESSTTKLNVQPENIERFLQIYTEVFQYQSDEQGLSFSLNTDLTDNIAWFDQDIFEKIIYNLLGNALKYTSENGSIEVKGKTRDGFLYLEVYNTSTPYTDQEIELLFTRFYQSKPNNSGTGIGLSLIKELVALHKGSISAKNSSDGIIFSVKIPILKEFYSEAEILSEQLYTDLLAKTEQIITATNPVALVTEDAPIILLADDSNDILNYLQSIFQDTYEVYTARDGEEAINIAKEHIPDIIVSDILMPKKDGYMVTETLKNDPLTSHIPIVLLTAKDKTIDELEAMDLGADGYMTKPFSSKLLVAKVQNLIETRRKLQQRFAQELILTPKEIAVTTADEEFLTRLQDVLDKHLTETDFTASKFSDVMLMNRMQLHRKLKALTGLSSSEFLRNQRLKMATQLLKTKDLSVSEIGYTIGFNDPSYFAKCFKQEYGMTPKEYTLKHKK